MTISIAIDCMGGDYGPSVAVLAALRFAEKEAEVELLLVGKKHLIYEQLKKNKFFKSSKVQVVDASEVVEMSDTLEIALRRKKNSSMRIAIQLVKDGRANACVSAGNTAALMGVSRYLLKTINGVDRPAICAVIPNQKNGPTYMLDLGANVDCEAHHLHQFAIMGSVLVSAIEGKKSPSVGLLNIGEESIKGNELVKNTAELLKNDHQKKLINFYGNVEGNNIFEGTTDIVVCDGFVGNVTLKAAEGVGRLIKNVMINEMQKSILDKFWALVGSGAIKRISQRLNPSRYNGASLLGLKGLVFKSHGGEKDYGFEFAIKRAFDSSKYDVLSQIENSISKLVQEN